LTSRAHPSQGTTTYAFDAENRLTQAAAPSGTTSFLYDGDGGRVKQVTASTTTVYVGPLYEKTGSTITKTILRGTELVASIQGGVVRFIHGDHLGSTNLLTDSTGAVVEQLEYTPYGSVSKKTGSQDLAQKFTGQRLDETIGLYFYSARYYDPLTGRFLSADPAQPQWSDPQDLNRYSYARNNPLKYIDPSGHGWFKKFFHKFFKAAVAAVIAVGAAVLAAMVPGAQPLLVAGLVKTGLAAFASTLALDTGEGRQFQRHLAKEVFDDAFGMSPRAASFTAGMVSHTIVSSAFYVGLTTLFPEAQPNTDFSKPENQTKISEYRLRGAHQPGGSTANFIRAQGGKADFLPQGVIASDTAFNDTPFVGPFFEGIGVRHAAFTTQLNGAFFDSAANIDLFNPLRGMIYASPWTGISHQAFFNTMIAGGVPGFQAIAQATTHAGWSFYLSSSLYGVNGAYGVSGIYSGMMSAERKK